MNGVLMRGPSRTVDAPIQRPICNKIQKKEKYYEKMIEKTVDPLTYDLHLNHVPFEFEVVER